MTEKRKYFSKKRVVILDTATDVFQQLGYDNATIEYITEQAGVSKRTVYSHFPNKEALLTAVLQRFMDEAGKLKQIRYCPHRSLESQLNDFADAKLAVVANPAWLSLMKITIGAFISHPELAKQIMTRVEDSEDTLALWLDAAKNDQRIKVDNTSLAAEVFWSMISGALFWPAIFQPSTVSHNTDEMKDELIRTFLAKYRSSQSHHTQGSPQ